MKTYKVGFCPNCGAKIKTILNPLTNPFIVVCQCGQEIKTKLIKVKK